MVAVVEIANLQRPCKKRIFWSASYAVLLFGKHVRTQEVKYRTHVEAGYEVYADYAVCNFFHSCYLIFVTYSRRTVLSKSLGFEMRTTPQPPFFLASSVSICVANLKEDKKFRLNWMKSESRINA